MIHVPTIAKDWKLPRYQWMSKNTNDYPPSLHYIIISKKCSTKSPISRNTKHSCGPGRHPGTPVWFVLGKLPDRWKETIVLEIHPLNPHFSTKTMIFLEEGYMEHVQVMEVWTGRWFNFQELNRKSSLNAFQKTTFGRSTVLMFIAKNRTPPQNLTYIAPEIMVEI